MQETNTGTPSCSTSRLHHIVATKFQFPLSSNSPLKLLTIRLKHYVTNRPKLNAPNAIAESR